MMNLDDELKILGLAPQADDVILYIEDLKCSRNQV